MPGFSAGGTMSKRSNQNLPNSGASFAGLRPGLGRAGVTKMFSLVGRGGGLHKPIVVFQNQVGGIGRSRLRNWGGVHRPVPVQDLVPAQFHAHKHQHEDGLTHDHDHDHGNDLDYGNDNDHDHDHGHDTDLNHDGVIDVEEHNTSDDFKAIAENIHIALNYTSTVYDIYNNLIDAYKKYKGHPCYHADLAGTAVMGTHSLEDCACNECNISSRVHKDLNGTDIYFAGKHHRCKEVAHGSHKAYLHIYKHDDDHGHDHTHDDYNPVDHEHLDTVHDIDGDGYETSIDNHVKDEVTQWVYNLFHKYSLSTPFTSDELAHYILHEVQSLSNKDKHMTFHKSMKDHVLSHVDDSDQLLCHDLECAGHARVLIKSKTLEHLLYENEQLDVSSCVSHKIVYGDNTLNLHFIKNMYIDVVLGMDADGDGKISLVEFTEYLKEDTDVKDKDIQDVFDRIDLNRDDLLDNYELSESLDTSGDGSVDTKELKDGIRLLGNKKRVLENLKAKVKASLIKKNSCRSMFIQEHIMEHSHTLVDTMITVQGTHKLHINLNTLTAIRVTRLCDDCITDSTVLRNADTKELHTPLALLHPDTKHKTYCLKESSLDLDVHVTFTDTTHTLVSFRDTWQAQSNKYNLFNVPILLHNILKMPTYHSTEYYLLAVIIPTTTQACHGPSIYLKSEAWRLDCNNAGCQTLHSCSVTEGIDAHTGVSTDVHLKCLSDLIGTKPLCYQALVDNIHLVVYTEYSDTESY